MLIFQQNAYHQRYELFIRSNIMRELNPTGVRLDNELKAKLQQSAKGNKRSLNSEIVARLNASYDNEIDKKLDEILRVLKSNT